MGSDITMCWELQIDSVWTLVDYRECDRNYSMFSSLNGHRCLHDPLYESRGFPDDISSGTRYWSTWDSTNRSWLTEVEFMEVWNHENGAGDSEFEERPTQTQPYLPDWLGGAGAPVRVVFWYDC